MELPSPRSPTARSHDTAVESPLVFKDEGKNVTSYSATVAIFEREDTEIRSSILDTFRKPSSATVHFSVGPSADVTFVGNGVTTSRAARRRDCRCSILAVGFS